MIHLYDLAKSVVDQPWGLGLPHLNNAEASAPYYRFLHAIVNERKPKLVVECGTYLGVATEHMAMGNHDTRVISIDHKLRKEAIAVGQRCDNVVLIDGDTVGSHYIVEIDCEAYNEKIGLLFLDSEHDGITARKEFEAYFHLFDDECIVACDDILDRDMKQFWDWLPGVKIPLHFLHPSQYPGFPEPGFGISIVRKGIQYA